MQFPTINHIRSLSIRPSKRHGQNFLIDRNIAEKTVAAARLCPGDVVIEIGPGLGSLTCVLERLGATAYCYEIDSRLFDILSLSLPRTSSVRVIHGDILRVSFADLAARHSSLVLLGSIPYSLTTPILLKFLEESRHIARAVFIVQKEVAERVCARPGTRSCGILSVYCLAYAPPNMLFTIPAECFYPVPEVSSAAIMLQPVKHRAWDDPHEVLFRNIVRTAFSRRRKTLLNALKSIFTAYGIQPGPVLEACAEAGIDMKRRPETLSLEEWYSLNRIFSAGLNRKGPSGVAD